MAKEINRADLVEIVPGVYKKNEKTFFIECSVNKTLHYCAAARLEKLKAKAGSLEEVGTSYISKEAKRIAKMAQVIEADSQPKETKVKALSSQGSPLPRPNPYSTFTHADGLVQSAVCKDGPVCMRGELFIQNNGYCNQCRWWNRCEYWDKKWASNSGAAPRNEAMFNLKASSLTIHTENEA